MKKKNFLFASFLNTLLFLHANDDINITDSKDMVIIPYAFSSDSTGFAGGVGLIKQGLFQPHTTLVFTTFYGAS